MPTGQTSFIASIWRRARFLWLTCLVPISQWVVDQIAGEAATRWLEKKAEEAGVFAFLGKLGLWIAGNPFQAFLAAAVLVCLGITLAAWLRPVEVSADADSIAADRTPFSEGARHQLVVLEPTLAHLRARNGLVFEEYANDGISADDLVTAAIASFRNPAGGVHVETVFANLLFAASNGEQLQRVDHAMWVGERYNSTSIAPGTTRQVIIAVWDAREQVFGVDDRRGSAERDVRFVPKHLPRRPMSVTLELAITDENGRKWSQQSSYFLNTQQPAIVRS